MKAKQLSASPPPSPEEEALKLGIHQIRLQFGMSTTNTTTPPCELPLHHSIILVQVLHNNFSSAFFLSCVHSFRAAF